MENTFSVFDRSWVFRSSLIAILAFSFVLMAVFGAEANTQVQKKAGSIRLTASFPRNTKQPKFWLRGKTEPGASLELFWDGNSQGFLAVGRKGEFRKKLSISVGTHTLQLTAINADGTSSYSRGITRIPTRAVDKYLGLSIIHSKNRTKKSSLSFYGTAYGVDKVRVSVNGTDWGYIPVKPISGHFRTRVTLSKGANIIAVTAVDSLYNVTATKRVIRK